MGYMSSLNYVKTFEVEDVCKLLFEDLPIGLIMLNSDANISRANNYIFNFFNEKKSDISGKKFGNVFNCNIATSKGIVCGTGNACKTCDINNGLVKVLNDGTELKEVELCHDFIMNGRRRTKWFIVNASRIKQDNKAFALVSFTDITKRKMAEKELIKLGITDELTGLYNRRFIFKQIMDSLNSMERNNYPISIAMLDIDRFKNINDTFGHAFGDTVLKDLADLLKSYTRETDYIGRYGGEEFLLIFNNTNINAANDVLCRIQEKFKELMMDKIDFPVSFSSGIMELKEYDRKFCDTINVINKVDKLMYKAKINGRNRIEIN